MHAYLRTTRLPGTAIVLSDFLVEPAVYESALDACCAGTTTTSRQSASSARWSATRRRCRAASACATPRPAPKRNVELTAALRQRYAEAVEQHLARLRDWCAARAIVCAAVDTADGLTGPLLTDLPRVGLLQ